MTHSYSLRSKTRVTELSHDLPVSSADTASPITVNNTTYSICDNNNHQDDNTYFNSTKQSQGCYNESHHITSSQPIISSTDTTIPHPVTNSPHTDPPSKCEASDNISHQPADVQTDATTQQSCQPNMVVSMDTTIQNPRNMSILLFSYLSKTR